MRQNAWYLGLQLVHALIDRDAVLETESPHVAEHPRAVGDDLYEVRRWPCHGF
jgi:hypothetical protein